MSWHCSRALVAEYSRDISLVGEPDAQLNITPTPEAFYWPVKTTEHSRLSRYGTTSRLLTASLGGELLMWCLEGSPAKLLAPPQEVQTTPPICGPKCEESSVKSSQVS